MNTIDKTSGLFEEEKKNRLLLKLSDNQKKALKNGSIGLGGVLFGASIMPLYGITKDNISTDEPIVDEPNVSIETELPMANVEDEMSFSDAFAAAREEVGAGGFFEWRENTYNTYYKEEWEAMSEKEQADYLASVEKATPTETMTEYTETTITIEVVEEDIPELEPIVGVDDLDEDGVIDAVAIDEDHDGYADVVALDVNGDGIADGIAYDEDFDGDIDVLVIDSGQDGFEENIDVEDMDGMVSMDDFIIMDEEEEETPEDVDIAYHDDIDIINVDDDIDDTDDIDL